MIAHATEKAAEAVATYCGATKDDAKAARALGIVVASVVDPVGACASLFSLFAEARKERRQQQR